MTPGKYDLKIYRGDTYRWRFTVWSDPARTQPADLTGATAKSEIRDKTGGTVKATINCVITIPNYVDAVLSDVASKALNTNGVWDLQLTMASGDVVTVLAGQVTVTGDVTDSTGNVSRSR
jgi:hypothetical protein